MAEENKKGVSDEARAYAKGVRRRFVDFVKSKGLSEVANQSGCNYQALRNSYVGIDEEKDKDKGYNPSLETIFQVKLGYGDDFDEVYVFTGKKVLAEKPVETPAVEQDDTNEHLEKELSALREKLKERDEQIKELKDDKTFLQSIIKKQQTL